MVEMKHSTFAESSLYTIGPPSFMERALGEFVEAGGQAEQAFASVETPTRCGVGLCGECSCGGHLTCREGTFFSYSFLRENNIKIEEVSQVTIEM